MQVEPQFYERLHTRDRRYGMNSYDVPRLMASRAFRDWLGRVNQGQLRLLDIGCGKGQFLYDLSEALRNREKSRLAKIAVVDLVKAPNNILEQINPAPEFHQQSVDGEKLPFADASFDFVSCNHVLEHVFRTEHLVKEIRRVLQPNGLAVISVPNIAAWMNRLLFLFGGQPLGTEVGTESVTYGFWPPFMQDKLKKFDASGHIRDFTPRALADLTSACGFRPAGWWAQNGGLIATMTRNLGILIEPLPLAPAAATQTRKD